MKLLLLLILMMSIGLADATYINDNVFGLGNGAYITVNATTIDDVNQLACCDYGLMLRINGSVTNYTAGTNKTITSVIFNNVTDTFTVPVSGTSGYFNISAIMLNGSHSYNLTADGAFVEARNTTASGYVWFNYSFTIAKTLVVSWNNSLGTLPPSNPPVITSNLNNLTGTSVTDITVNVNNAILFSVGANQTITTWTWGGATKIGGDGTTNSTASHLFSSVGDTSVTVQGTNANGSTSVLTWTVHVVTGGGGGTDWDYLTGTVNVAGAMITTNPNVGGTTGGAYSFGYVFIDGQTYWINVSKAGYDSNNTQITFNTDHEIWNPTLSLTPSPPPPPNSTYWNSLTQDESLYVKPQELQSVTFRLLNANITSTVWTSDNVVQGETSANYTQVFNNIGHHNISAIGTTPEGTTPMILWQILTVRQKSGAGDVTPNLNTSWFDSLLTSMSGSHPDFTVFINALMLPFSTSMGALFYVFLFLLPMVVIWIRQEKSILPVGLGVIFGGLLIGFLPEAWQLPLQLFIVLTTLGVMYSLFKERG